MRLNSSIALSLSALFLLGTSIACSGGGGGGGGGGTATNKFSAAASRAMTAEDLAPSSRTGTADYSGSFLYKDNGGTVFSGSFTFVLENDGVNIYFKSFEFGKIVSLTGYNVAAFEEAASAVCFTNGTYDANNNHIDLVNGTNRVVAFELDLDACNAAGIADIDAAGALFSNDFSTMVGGDDDTFFMVAQKSTSTPTYALANVAGNLGMYWFSIDGTGGVTAESGYSDEVTVSGGTWSTDDGGGVLKSTDATSGGFLYQYTGSPAAQIDGGFIVSPDKSFVLGIDLAEGVYFAASK